MMPIGVSLADATNVAAQAGAPVTFGAFAFGGSAGGVTLSDNDTASPKGDATAVTPVTTTQLNPMQQLAELAGLGSVDPLGTGLQTATQFMANSGFGTNAAMSQMLPGTASQMGGKSTAAIADETPSFMPGPIALVGIGVAVVGAIFMMR